MIFSSEGLKNEEIIRVVDTYANTIYKICFVILCNKADAEDAMQNTFLKYIIKAPTFKDTEHEKAWLIRAAQSTSKDMYRYRKRRIHIQLEDIEEHYQFDESGEIIKKVMELPEKYKVILSLYYISGYKTEEIAGILKIFPATVRKRLQYLEAVKLSLEVNELDKEPVDLSFGLCLYTDDFVSMTETELLKYYSISLPIEQVLPILKEQNNSFGIYKRKNQEIYYDINSFDFESDDDKQHLSILVSKGKLPDTGFTNLIEGYTPYLKKSEVNKVEIVIAHYNGPENSDKYYAEFIFNENGYKVFSENMSLNDFTKALVALVY